MERFVIVDEIVEHLRVRLEAHGGAGMVRLGDDGHVLRLDAAGKLHLVDVPVFVDLHLQPLAERVDDARADAVETAGDLVAAAAELAAGVEHGVDDLQRGKTGLLLNIDGNASAVVRDADDVAGLDRDRDVLAVARERLVDGVVYNLVDEVVQTARRRGADIHARTLPDRLQTL